MTKQKCGEDWNHCEKLRYYPRLEQWLQVVGINEEAIKVRIANYIHVIKIFEMWKDVIQLVFLFLFIARQLYIVIIIWCAILLKVLHVLASNLFMQENYCCSKIILCLSSDHKNYCAFIEMAMWYSLRTFLQCKIAHWDNITFCHVVFVSKSSFCQLCTYKCENKWSVVDNYLLLTPRAELRRKVQHHRGFVIPFWWKSKSCSGKLCRWKGRKSQIDSCIEASSGLHR